MSCGPSVRRRRSKMHKSLLLFSLFWIFQSSLAISPFFLWRVINTTIERKNPSKYIDWNPSTCPRLIFHNNSTLASVGEHSGTAGSFAFDISSISEPDYEFPNFSDAKAFLEAESNRTILHGSLRGPSKEILTTRKVYEPCVTVVSIIVNATEIEFDKVAVSKQMVELFQYNTPVRNRHLFLVRLAEKEEELFDCTVFRGAADFPTRLMPMWEMVLFDFFTDARVIQGLMGEEEDKAKNALKVGRDPGLWLWLCNDIVGALEQKKECLAGGHDSDDCRIWAKVVDTLDQSCVTGYSPRH